MKRFLPTLSAVAILTLPHLASAQTYSLGGNNPTVPGIYAEGMLGLNLADDTDFDIENVEDDAKSTYDIGAFGAIALGYSIPQGPLNIRVEGELNIRGNALDEFEFADGTQADGENDAATASIAGMANAYVDYYVFPNLAASVGAGVGYANVEVDIVVDLNGDDTQVVDEDDDSAFAYQFRLGGRYDLDSNSTITGGYTYFATGDLKIEDVGGNELTFDYASHTFHLGYAYRF